MKLIYIQLSGGIGNQLFQVLSIYGLSRYHGRRLIISHAVDGNGPKHSHETEVGAVCGAHRLSPFVHKIISRLLRAVHVVSPRLVELRTEKSFNLDQLLFGHSSAFLLYVSDSLLQDFRYFAPNAPVGLISYYNDLRRAMRKECAWFNTPGVNYIAVHVRRGDYVIEKQMTDLSDLRSCNYYKSAINSFKHERAVFVFFSDDPDWIHSKVGDLGLTQPDFLVFDAKYSPLETFTALSLFDKIISANSTFSLVAAYFSARYNEECSVVVPLMWKPSGERPYYPIKWKTF